MVLCGREGTAPLGGCQDPFGVWLQLVVGVLLACTQCARLYAVVLAVKPSGVCMADLSRWY